MRAKHGTPSFEVVLAVEGRSVLAELYRPGPAANVESGIRLNLQDEGDRGSHDTSTMPNRGDLFSQKSGVLVG